MKQLAVLGVLLGVLFGFAASAKAEGIEAGSQLASGYLGFGVPLQESGVKAIGNTELDWGDVSASYGASYLFFPSEYFGMGVELNGNNFTEAEYTYAFGVNHAKFKTSMNVYNYMLAFRANVNPQNRVRFYVPFGFGLTSAKGKVKDNGYVTGLGYFDEEISKTSTSLGYFIGAGVEADLGDSNWVLGGEIRYSGFKFAPINTLKTATVLAKRTTAICRSWPKSVTNSKSGCINKKPRSKERGFLVSRKPPARPVVQ